MTPDDAILFHESTTSASRDIWLLRLGSGADAKGERQPIVRTPFDDRNAVSSPDGRWLAYESNKSGRFEIYVRPLSTPDEGEVQLSPDGGRQPAWSTKGNEVFFLKPVGSLNFVPVAPVGATWKSGNAARVLEGPYFTGGGNIGRSYDVSPDVQRFLMLTPGVGDVRADPTQILVVSNWFDELKRMTSTR